MFMGFLFRLLSARNIMLREFKLRGNILTQRLRWGLGGGGDVGEK